MKCVCCENSAVNLYRVCLYDQENVKQNVLNIQVHDVCSKFASCLFHRVNTPLLTSTHCCKNANVEENKRPTTVVREGRPYRLIFEDQRPTSGLGKKAISESDYSPIPVMATLVYRTLQSMIAYDTVSAHVW